VRGRTALLGAGVVALFLVHALYLSGVAEDAFISFRFARNLVEGHGLVWNPGEAPVEGYTNFLWVLCSALWIALGLDPVRGAQALGLLSCLATLWLTWRAGTRALGWSAAEALLPCLFLAVAGPFAAWATGGLETSAFGLLLLLGVYRFSLYWHEGGRRHLTLAFLALLLSALTRPEGLLALGGIGVLGVALAAGRSGARRDLAPGFALALGGFAVYVGWRWHVFGELLPNTFYAKTGDTAAQMERGAEYVGWFALHYLLPWLPLLLLAWWRSAIPSGLRRQPLLLACALLVTTYVLGIVWEGGDYMAMYRFLAPLLPFVYLLLVAAVRPALRAGSPAGLRAAGALALACAVAGTAFHSTPLEVLLPLPPRLHGNWRGVQTERWHVGRLSEIGRFFAHHAKPGESLATDAIGAIGWYSHMTVYGAHGLVDPVLARRRAGTPVGSGIAGHERLDFGYLLARRPTYLMFRRELRAQPLRRLDFGHQVDPRLAAEYELRSVWLEDPANGEAGWFSFLERRDRS
jgi:arabinofuranosyltransferase